MVWLLFLFPYLFLLLDPVPLSEDKTLEGAHKKIARLSDVIDKQSDLIENMGKVLEKAYGMANVFLCTRLETPNLRAPPPARLHCPCTSCSLKYLCTTGKLRFHPPT